jgi:hypothetical protein
MAQNIGTFKFSKFVPFEKNNVVVEVMKGTN